MKSNLLSAGQRLWAIAGAILIVSTLFLGAAATAQPRTGAFYRATMSTPVTAQRAVAGAVVWSCTDTSCSAPRGNSRATIMCARLVREVGTVTSFVAGEQTLTAEELARCNAAA